MNFINIAAYRFISLEAEQLLSIQTSLRSKTLQLGLKGSILLSTEGINLFVAGEHPIIQSFKSYLDNISAFSNLTYKESASKKQPFDKMVIKIKKEIIPLGLEYIQPEKGTAPYISPETFKEWNVKGQDMLILDTRNDYEIEYGTFKAAINLNLKHFRDFPKAIQQLPESAKSIPIVTFCTGGIRCEKAAAFMLEQGFKEVYQLDGGILNYFEKCGEAFYDGSCFVFDKRVAVDSSLIEINAINCRYCGNLREIDKDSATLEKCPCIED